MEIVFVKTHHQYDSYIDFWRLVELSEFPAIYAEAIEWDDPDKFYITAPYNGEWQHHLGWRGRELGRSCTLALWNLERPGAQSIEQYAADQHRLINMEYFDRVIVSDRWLAKQADLDYVPLGSHYGLGGSGGIKQYDAIHLMCYSLRRSFMFDYLTPHANLNGLTIAPNGWGIDRHNALLKSRFMLNIHQDDHCIMEPLRFALAAAYGLPILSEFCYDSFPYHNNLALRWVMPNKADVVSALEQACEKYQSASHVAEVIRAKMCSDWSFRSCIERYVS